MHHHLRGFFPRPHSFCSPALFHLPQLHPPLCVSSGKRGWPCPGASGVPRSRACAARMHLAMLLQPDTALKHLTPSRSAAFPTPPGNGSSPPRAQPHRPSSDPPCMALRCAACDRGRCLPGCCNAADTRGCRSPIPRRRAFTLKRGKGGTPAFSLMPIRRSLTSKAAAAECNSPACRVNWFRAGGERQGPGSVSGRVPGIDAPFCRRSVKHPDLSPRPPLPRFTPAPGAA